MGHLIAGATCFRRVREALLLIHGEWVIHFTSNLAFDETRLERIAPSFTTPRSLGGLVTLAAKVGANEKTVRSAIETEKHKGVIEKDMAVASDGGIEGTPGFVINKGWHIGGAESYRTFQRVIEHALQHP
ncbi:MAG: DsbA family protein [Akkermansiaceae bacterium]